MVNLKSLMKKKMFVPSSQHESTIINHCQFVCVWTHIQKATHNGFIIFIATIFNPPRLKPVVL